MKMFLKGRTVGYEERGKGTPLLFIHGFPLNRMIWQAQWEDLSSQAHVLVPDLRGFGETPMIDRAPSMATYADDLHDFIMGLSLVKPIVICGFSMGGYIALAYARKYGDQLAGLILANTKATADSEEAKAGRDKNSTLVKTSGPGALADIMLPKLFAPKTYTTNPALVAQTREIMISASVPGIVGALAAMRDRPDTLDVLRNVRMPTLIITGSDDALMSIEEQNKMQKAALLSKLVVIPDAGHLSNMEQPKVFNRAIGDFLREIESR